MKKVIVFGTGKLSKVLEDSINKNVEIIAYADNDRTKWGSVHNDKIVIQPNNILNYDFDYILIGSQFNEEIYTQLLNFGIDNEKIFEFGNFLDFGWDYVRYSIDCALCSKGEIETLVTGISYSYCGLDINSYKKNAYNLANVSQDLFYDYNLVKFLLENNKFENLKEVIIGLCYYSFQYDMSSSGMKSKCALYYKNIKVKHNYINVEKFSDNIDKNNRIANKIFSFYDTGNAMINWGVCENKYTIDDGIGKWQADLDCNKEYPKTVEENICIFKNYLKFLKDKNIKPVVVVFPASKHYTQYFSDRIENEFHEIINMVRKEYDFQYIDYFKSNLFEDNDFKDVSHLNLYGAKKFTEILNEIIV
ncbi:D-alanyl-lipoteichoic acid biosynthesis protein DltD [Clostridium sp. YIM B02555]|uniref:D-alanyl-lipoteichoic acid biosynthesis protein DltD n=1 Tax=Clostridium sp. YIM B02555 TaxID=2911968 RepID=UPI001EED7E7D|nr:D-alanyl-lipoteichoic acid biosynthesis protein DltD [Clostridium sp. YIM B02555]